MPSGTPWFSKIFRTCLRQILSNAFSISIKQKKMGLLNSKAFLANCLITILLLEFVESKKKKSKEDFTAYLFKSLLTYQSTCTATQSAWIKASTPKPTLQSRKQKKLLLTLTTPCVSALKLKSPKTKNGAIPHSSLWNLKHTQK